MGGLSNLCLQSGGSSCPTSGSGTEVLAARGLRRRGKKTTPGSPQIRAPRPSVSPGMLSKFWESHCLTCPEAAGPLVQRGPALSLKEKRKCLILVCGAGHWRLPELSSPPPLLRVSDNPPPNHCTRLYATFQDNTPASLHTKMKGMGALLHQSETPQAPRWGRGHKGGGTKFGDGYGDTGLASREHPTFSPVTSHLMKLNEQGSQGKHLECSDGHE